MPALFLTETPTIMKNKIKFFISFSFLFFIQCVFSQTNNKIDSAFIITNMIKAVSQKDYTKVGEELYLMKNGKIKFHPAYIDFFTALQSIVSFQKMDSASIGPIVLIDSAVFYFYKALAYDKFQAFDDLEIKNPKIGIQYCVDVTNARGKTYFEMSEWMKSLESYEKGLSYQKNYISALGAGLSSMKKEYFTLAQKYFMMVIELNPTRVNSFVLLSEAYIKDSKIDSAVKIIDSAYPVFKDSLTFLMQAYNVYNLKNDTNKCIEILNTIISKEKNNPEIYFNLGVLYEKKNNIRLAETNYKSAIKISPNEYKYNFNLTALYFNRYAQLSNDIALKQNLEHYNLEEKHLERISWISKTKPYLNVCLKSQPDNVHLLTILYYYYFTLEETENAQKTLKRIEELKK